MQSKIGPLQILVDAVFVLGASSVHRTCLKEKYRFHVEMAVFCCVVGERNHSCTTVSEINQNQSCAK